MNKDRPIISEEFLNAFVDNQLTQEEKAAAYEQINENKEINMQICQLRKVSDLVRLAYDMPPAPPQNKPVLTANSFSLNIAACILASMALVLGVVLGWNIGPAQDDAAMLATHNKIQQDHVQISQSHAQNRANTKTSSHTNPKILTAANDESDQIKIMLHLNSGDPELIHDSLDELESLLKHYRQTGQRARIEMVTNGGGISLLRVDASPFPERIKRMQQEYDNLTFVACQNSMNRLKDETGITAKLIPGVVVIDSGVAQLMRRQHQGWAYIRV